MNLGLPGSTQFYTSVAVVVIGFIAYVYTWKKNKLLALAILLSMVCWVVYMTADWDYLDRYFKLNWDMSRY